MNATKDCKERLDEFHRSAYSYIGLPMEYQPLPNVKQIQQEREQLLKDCPGYLAE